LQGGDGPVTGRLNAETEDIKAHRLSPAFISAVNMLVVSKGMMDGGGDPLLALAR
jgi:hypothetical protein